MFRNCSPFRRHCSAVGRARYHDHEDLPNQPARHLQLKSVRVKAGDTVRRGQVLGLVGNSGHTDAPHLHFHVSDGKDPLASEGVPFVFDTFTRDGVIYRDEMPLGDWVVSFR